VSHRLLCALGTLLVTTLGLPLSAVAQETEETQAIEKTENADESAKAEEDEGWLSHFSGAIQADFSNAYYFRGILQERDSFIAEPWGELYYSLYSSEDGPIRDVSVGGGVWASFHTEETGASDNPKSLYEVDWYPIISIGLPQSLSLTTIYYFYTSPNDAFRTVQELNFKLAWDDSEALGRFALQPWINLAIEINRTSFGNHKGEGLQLGVEPTLFEIPFEDYPVTFTAPVEIGLALKNYYERDDDDESTFGYLSFGMGASVPLAFMPECLGSWTFSVKGKGYWLNHTLANANLGRTMSPQVTGSLGLEF